jgi:phytoene desaturase
MIDGTPLTDDRIGIVGGGVGGLASACYLADAGADVTVIERNDRLGGVANQLERDGFVFDTGPTWYLMPDTFERFFGHFGRSPGEFYDLERLDPHYRVFWKEGATPPTPGDGDYVETRPDHEHNRAVFEALEPGGGETFEAYLDEAERTFRLGMDRFVYQDRSRLRDLLDFDVIRSVEALGYAKSMQSHVERYFEEPTAQQLMQYTLVFLGGSPHDTPALYNLMAHVDFDLGVYYPEGGMYSVIEALVELGRDLGVNYETGRAVTSIREPAAGGGVVLETEDGPEPVDTVVANANPAHVERDLLAADHRDHDPGYWDEQTYAPAAFLLYLGVEGDVDPLAHHTLVFPEDWDPHFADIFEHPAWPEDPAYYCCVPSQTDDTVAPEGQHAVVVLVPVAPGLDDDPERRRQFRDKVLADLARDTGVDLRDRIVVEETACVSEFAERYNNPQGTALGLAHTLTQTGPLRPGRRSRALSDLYYVGGFTAPGIGVPMALISGEQTADAVAEAEHERDGVRSLLPV